MDLLIMQIELSCVGEQHINQKEIGDGSLDVIGTNLRLSKAEARSDARQNLIDLIKLVNFDGRIISELIDSDRLIEKNRNINQQCISTRRNRVSRKQSIIYCISS